MHINYSRDSTGRRVCVCLCVCVQSDYVPMADQECYLRLLANKPPGVFPRIVSVISWKEVV